MRTVLTWAIAACVVGALACTPIERQPPEGRARPAEAVRMNAATSVPTGTVITTLQTRDHEVTVYAGQGGLRFTVMAAGGVVLAAQLSEGDFARSFPGLFHRYDSAFAGERVWVDASVAPAIDASL